MNALRRLRRTAAPLLTPLLAASLVFAQQPGAARPAAQQKPNAPAQRKIAAPAPQQQRPATREGADAADVTLDTLFGADSYAVYGEMRSVGQYVSSDEFKQMMGPLRLPGSMPSEMGELIDFFAAHAESLSTARVAFGAMPVADGLPDVVAAVEMPSAEDARKFEPQMRQFLASYYAAHAEAAGEGEAARAGATAGARAATLGASPARVNETAGARANDARRAATQQQTQSARQQNAQTIRAGERVAADAAAPYVVVRAGAVVAVADKQFTFRRLRGAEGSTALIDEPGFAAARARLATDTLFLYFNTTRVGRYTKRQREEYERQYKQMQADAEAAGREQRDYSRSVNVPGGGSATASVNVTRDQAAGTTRITSEISGPSPAANGPALPTPDPRATSNVDPRSDGDFGAAHPSRIVINNGNNVTVAGPPDEKLTPEQQAQSEAVIAEVRAERQKEEEAERQRRSQPGYEEERRRQEFESQLGQTIFSGDVARGQWADSIGVGASLEGDQLVVRALFYSDSDAAPARPIPFVPIMISGPAVAPEAASVAPADADILISASLDLPQMYDYVASAFKIFDVAANASGNTDRLGLFDKQIGSFEQQSKFRIKEDLLSSLGNEIAVVLPGDYLGVRRKTKPKKQAAPATAGDAQAQDAPAGTTAPVVIISLRDKKTVEGLLPRALEAAGLKGVSEGQLLVKRGDADVLAFGGGSAAFLGNFLVVSFDPQAMDWIVDSYNRGETLANSEEFRRASGWQQRQLLGQVFVSNSLLRDAFGDVHASVDDLEDAQLRAFVSQLDPNPGAITYALERDGASLFHELHVPKNLLALMSASSLVAQQTATRRFNENRASSSLEGIVTFEEKYRTEHGRYAALEELDEQANRSPHVGRQTFSLLKPDGYEIKLSVSGDKFEATATPTGYPKQGRRSFYIDQTGVLRGGDTGGKPATAENDPVSY